MSSIEAEQRAHGADGTLRNEGERSPFRGAAVLLFSAGVLATVLALWFSSRREFWLDEYYTALLADLPFGEMARYIAGDTHPPLYYVIIGLWRRVFGDSELALRAFSTTMHLLGGGIFFHFLRSVFARTDLAVLGTILFLLSPGLLFYAAEARMYSLGVVLLTAASYLVWRQLAGTGRTGEAVLLGGLCALAFYTHYTTLFISAALFVYWAATQARRRGSWRQHLVAVASFGVLTAPWVPVVLRQMAGKRRLTEAMHASWSDPTALTYFADGAPDLQVPNPLVEFPTNIASLTGVYPATGLAITALLALPFLAVLGLGALRTVRGDGRGLLVGLAIAANVAGCLAVGIMDRRYMLWLVPLLVLFLCLGMLEARQRWARSVHVVLAVALVLLTTAGAVRVARSTGYARIAPHVEWIRGAYRPDDLVVFSAAYGQVAFDYQARRVGFEPERRGFPETVYEWWERQGTRGWGSPVIRRADLEAFLDRLEHEDRTRIWLLEFEADHYDPHGQLLAGFGARGWSVATCLPPGTAPQPYRLYLITSEAAGQCAGAESGPG